MLVNQSTLRAVVRKYLLKEITLDSVASVVGNTATMVVPGLAAADSSIDAITRRSARQNFMVVNPWDGSNSPSAMTQNATDGSTTPQQKIEHLYNYVNNNNIGVVYLAIIKILKDHAGDLDAEESKIESLYGQALLKSLTRAAGSSFTSAQPLPEETATLTGLPVAPAGPNDVATVAQLTAQRDKALAQADARSLPNALQALLDFTTSRQHAFATYDYNKLNNARQAAVVPGATADSIAALLAGAAILSIDKTKFQTFATQYLKNCVSVGIEETNKWAENYILTTDLLKSGTTPAAPGAKLQMPECLNAFVNFTTSQLNVTYDKDKINNANVEAAGKAVGAVAFIAALLVDASSAVNKPSFQKLAIEYLNTCVSSGIDRANGWALSSLQSFKMAVGGAVAAPTVAASPASAKKPTGPRLPNKQLVKLLGAQSNWDSINQKWNQLLSNYAIYTAGPSAQDITSLVKANWAKAAGLISTVRSISNRQIVFRDGTGRGFTPDQNGMINFINSLQQNRSQNYAPVAQLVQPAATVSPGIPAPAPTPAPAAQKQSPKRVLGKLRNKMNTKKAKKQ